MKITYDKIVVLGYTGAVGKLLLLELIQSDRVREIVCIGRSEPHVSHHKIAFVKTDLEAITDSLEHFNNTDCVISCLGTTLKKAGSPEAFRKVDYTYIVNAANAAYLCGVRNFVLVSSVGADPKAKVLYSRTKGETEQALIKIGFKHLSIFQPSILVGPRSDFRFGEQIGIGLAKLIDPIMVGSLSKYRLTKMEHLVKAMVAILFKAEEGTEYYSSQDIRNLAKHL